MDSARRYDLCDGREASLRGLVHFQACHGIQLAGPMKALAVAFRRTEIKASIS